MMNFFPKGPASVENSTSAHVSKQSGLLQYFRRLLQQSGISMQCLYKFELGWSQAINFFQDILHVKYDRNVSDILLDSFQTHKFLCLLS